MTAATPPIITGRARHQKPVSQKRSAPAAQPAANRSTLTATRDNRVRTALASPAAVPASRSTASIVAWVVEPVISVVGGRLARCTRCSAFCKAIAAIPAKPVSSAIGLSASAKGPKITASAKNAASRTNSIVSMIRSTGQPRLRATPPRSRASAITVMNSGSARILLRMPWLPSTSAAPSVTKLPVTWATKSPLRPRNPTVSTKPPLKESRAATLKRPRGWVMQSCCVAESSRGHAFGLEHVDGIRCFEKVEKSLGGVRIFAVGADGADKDEVLLQISREGASQFDTRREQNIGEKDAEFGLAFDDRLWDLTGRTLHSQLVLDLLRDAETLEYLMHEGASRARREHGDRLRFHQRRRQRFGCAHVGLCSARLHRDAVTDSCDIGRRAGKLRARIVVLHHIDGHNAEIERCQRRHLDQLGCCREGDVELVAAGGLELRPDLLQARGHRTARQYLQFRACCGGNRRHRHRQAKQRGRYKMPVHRRLPVRRTRL